MIRCRVGCDYRCNVVVLIVIGSRLTTLRICGLVRHLTAAHTASILGMKCVFYSMSSEWVSLMSACETVLPSAGRETVACPLGCNTVIDKRLVEYHFAMLPSQDISRIPEQQHISSVRTLDGVLASMSFEIENNSYIASGDAPVGAPYLAEASYLVNEEAFD